MFAGEHSLTANHSKSPGKDEDNGKELYSDASTHRFDCFALTAKQGYDPDNEKDRCVRTRQSQERLAEEMLPLVFDGFVGGPALR